MASPRCAIACDYERSGLRRSIHGSRNSPARGEKARRAGSALNQFELSRGFWDAIGALNDNFGVLGYAIIGIFVLGWALSAVIYRVRGYDTIDAGA